MKIVYSPNAIARQTDVHNVDVAPLSEMDYSIDKMCCFNTLITTDLQLQKMDAQGSLVKQRKRD
jgi:hypothetical protein